MKTKLTKKEAETLIMVAANAAAKGRGVRPYRRRRDVVFAMIDEFRRHMKEVRTA